MAHSTPTPSSASSSTINNPILPPHNRNASSQGQGQISKYALATPTNHNRKALPPLKATNNPNFNNSTLRGTSGGNDANHYCSTPSPSPSISSSAPSSRNNTLKQWDVKQLSDIERHYWLVEQAKQNRGQNSSNDALNKVYNKILPIRIEAHRNHPAYATGLTQQQHQQHHDAVNIPKASPLPTTATMTISAADNADYGKETGVEGQLRGAASQGTDEENRVPYSGTYEPNVYDENYKRASMQLSRQQCELHHGGHNSSNNNQPALNGVRGSQSHPSLSSYTQRTRHRSENSHTSDTQRNTGIHKQRMTAYNSELGFDEDASQNSSDNNDSDGVGDDNSPSSSSISASEEEDMASTSKQITGTAVVDKMKAPPAHANRRRPPSAVDTGKERYGDGGSGKRESPATSESAGKQDGTLSPTPSEGGATSPTYHNALNDTNEIAALVFNYQVHPSISMTRQLDHLQKRSLQTQHRINDDNQIPFREALPSRNERTLKVFVGTWNLHAKPFPQNLNEFIKAGYDLYAIGTEECENSIEKSLLFSSKLNWSTAIGSALGDRYVEVGQETLVAMHIIVFIRSSLSHLVSNISTGRVATGIHNQLGNKGGVAIGFDLGLSSVLFVTSHFQAHQHNVIGRNADYMRINTRLPMRLPIKSKNKSNSNSNDENKTNNLDQSSTGIPERTRFITTTEEAKREHDEESFARNAVKLDSPLVTDRYEHAFWSGDLNYRVHANRRMADALIEKGMYEVMLANDQLIHERARHRVFCGFVEGSIQFPPTYKFDSNSDKYDTSKKARVPSWTDRILYKPSDAVEMINYDSVRQIRSSDHRPVYATFRLRIQLPPITHSDGTETQVAAGQIDLLGNDESNSSICVIQ